MGTGRHASASRRSVFTLKHTVSTNFASKKVLAPDLFRDQKNIGQLLCGHDHKGPDIRIRTER
jgi:hypothetical protein